MAWVSPADRKALKRAAAEADATLAELVRGLARCFVNATIDPAHVLSGTIPRAYPGAIPCLFLHDANERVTNRVRPGCEWAADGYGVITEKLEGILGRVTTRNGSVVRSERFRPPGTARRHRGIHTGWFVEANEFSADDQPLLAAVRGTDTSAWPDDEHVCVAHGPGIGQNPLRLRSGSCVRTAALTPYTGIPRTFWDLRRAVSELESLVAPGRPASGLVFHHPDGRACQLTRSDFGLD